VQKNTFPTKPKTNNSSEKRKSEFLENNKKLVEDIKKKKIDSIFFTNESPVDQKN
jgi:hypothetical protein